jgi:purine nucleosidase/pyrimidine-specific ribonucleoside hydrolase
VTPVLIDTDPGVDDALALLLAWGSPEISVHALTTVAGNVPVDLATVNACRLVALRRPRPLPALAVGAATPLARPLVTATHYHGEDGLGDVGEWPSPTITPSPMGATELMVRMARHYGSHLCLVALGPLTNVALALEADQEAMRRIGRLVVMGGAVDVPGNATPAAEFNLHVDPEAAARVFASGLPIELVPLDATRQAIVPRARLEAALASGPRRLAESVAAFTAGAFRRDIGRGHAGMVLHDPLAVAVAVREDFVQWQSMRLAVGAHGETRRANGAPNCRVATRVSGEPFLAAFLERLASP